MSEVWHFPIMIFASFILFYVVILIVIGKHKLIKRTNSIILLSILCVFVGMLFGKFGANFGLPWWIYYSIPMLINVLMPPIILKLSPKGITIYLILSFLSAPIVHTFFSLFLDWHEYMPFWKIQSL